MTKKTESIVKQLAQLIDDNSILCRDKNELRDILSDLLIHVFKQDPKIMTSKIGLNLVTRAHVAKAIHIQPKEDRPPEDVWVTQYRRSSRYNFGGIYDTEEGAINALKEVPGGDALHYKLAD